MLMGKRSIQTCTRENTVSTAEVVSFLKQPTSYPYQTTSVEVKETHMSCVFLVDGWVYKLKKPVKYPFLDLSFTEARLRNCKEEVRLNKKFARGIYKGIVPLTVNTKGILALNGKGQIIDWLVWMKRIPQEEMLDYAIIHQTADEAQLTKPAALLVKFYKRAKPIVIEPEIYRGALKADINAAYTELNNPAFHLSLPLIAKLAAGLFRFLSEHSLLFDIRVSNKKIIEAHGDLKPEHICVGPKPAIIDCLEFSRELRIMDMAEELSFLAMECELLGNLAVGKVFFDTYTALTGDKIPRSLIAFYKLKRAFHRSFLVARHISEASYMNDPKWITKANCYLQLAERYYALLI
jgi:aminoglycoside phosphotransferase family enzyme